MPKHKGAQSANQLVRFKDAKVEPRAAAFLGYDDVGSFRRFLFSPAVLRWYDIWYEICREGSLKTSLDIIRDLDPAQFQKSFPTDVNQLCKMYPIDNQPASDSKLKGDQRVLRAFNARRRANRLVAVLHNLYREIAPKNRCRSRNSRYGKIAKSRVSRHPAIISSYRPLM
jgi:hypothetical protein